MKDKVVLVYSGGLDSTVLLYHLIDLGYEVKCLSFDYDQRHKKEINYAYDMCKNLNIPYRCVDLTEITDLIDNSSQTGDIDVPHGHYEQENMKLTVVPNRNMIMLSIAIGHAINIGYDKVAYGAHTAGHYIYPDCQPEFINAMREASSRCDEKYIRIFTPFDDFDKGAIVKLGIKLKVPFEFTWTCYEGKDTACGKCGSCRERLEAFKNNNLTDPLVYV